MGCQSSKAMGEGRGMYGEDGGAGQATGSKMRVYKQDPTVHGVGTRNVWIVSDVKDGPCNSDIEIRGMERAYTPNEDGDFLFEPETEADAFDAAHTFAVVDKVLTIYRRALRRMKLAKDLSWQWGTDTPLRVFPYAGNMANAFYHREYRALAFFHFIDTERGKTVRTCQSWDVVAHEAGHAILDSLKPNYMRSTNAQCAALHEAFGDVTTIFTLLDQLDMCETIIVECKGDLHNRSMLAHIGEEFGSAIGRKYGLRNADHDITLKDVSEEVHDLSRVFTSAIYDILVEIYDATRDSTKYSPAETLFRAGKRLSSIFLVAVISSPEENATFRDVAEKMVDTEPKPNFKKIIREEFNRRLVFDKDIKPKPWDGPLAANACGTMKSVGDKDIENQLLEFLKSHLPEPEQEKSASEKEAQPEGEEEKEALMNKNAAEQKEEKVEIKQAPTAEPENLINGVSAASSDETEETKQTTENEGERKLVNTTEIIVTECGDNQLEEETKPVANEEKAVVSEEQVQISQKTE